MKVGLFCGNKVAGWFYVLDSADKPEPSECWVISKTGLWCCVCSLSTQVQRQIQEPLPEAVPLLLCRAEEVQKCTLSWCLCELFMVPSLNVQGLGWAPLRAVVWMWGESGVPENWAEFGKGFISGISKSRIPSLVSSNPLLFLSAWSEAVLSFPCTPSPLPFVSAFWNICFCSLPTDGQMFYLLPWVWKSNFHWEYCWG